MTSKSCATCEANKVSDVVKDGLDVQHELVLSYAVSSTLKSQMVDSTQHWSLDLFILLTMFH